MINKITLGCLVTLPFLFPYHAHPLVTFHAEFFTFWLAWAFVCGVMWTRPLRFIPIAALALPLYALLLLARTPWLAYWERPAFAAFYLLTAFMVAWAAQSIEEKPGEVPIELLLLRSIAVGGFLMAALGFVQHFELTTIFGRLVNSKEAGGMMGPIGQRSLFAVYVSCGIAALIASRTRTQIVLLAGIPMAIALAFSGARIAWPLIFIAFLACREDRRLGAFANWCLLFMVFAFAWINGGAEVVTRPAGISANASEAIGSRTALLSVAWRVWLEQPIFGAGFGEFAYQFLNVARSGDPNADRFAHNIVAQVLLEAGLVGALILGAGAVLWLKALREVSAINWGLLALLGMLFLFSLSEFPFWHAQFLLLTAVLMAVAILRTPDWRLMLGGWYVELHKRFLTFAIRATIILAAIAMLWALEDFRVLRDYYDGRANQINTRSLFRPNIEFMATAGGLFPRRFEFYEVELMMNERAMHFYPHHDLLCRQISLMEEIGSSVNHLRARDAVLYPDSPRCPAKKV